MSLSIEKSLEQYTLQHPQEVLLISLEVNGEPDQILMFRGFGSSLVRPTAYDPDVPVISPEAVITVIDRLASPYSPDAPVYLEQGIPWQDFAERLSSSPDKRLR